MYTIHFSISKNARKKHFIETGEQLRENQVLEFEPDIELRKKLAEFSISNLNMNIKRQTSSVNNEYFYSDIINDPVSIIDNYFRFVEDCKLKYKEDLEVKTSNDHIEQREIMNTEAKLQTSIVKNFNSELPEYIDFRKEVSRILQEKEEKAKELNRIAKLEAERKEENYYINLKEESLRDGTELLKERIKGDFNWKKLAEIERISRLSGLEVFELKGEEENNDWEVANPSLEEIKELREIELKLKEYNYSVDLWRCRGYDNVLTYYFIETNNQNYCFK